MTLQQFARTTVVIQLVPHFVAKGVSVGLASSMMSAFGIFAVISKLVSGWLSDIIPSRFILVIVVIFQMTEDCNLVMLFMRFILIKMVEY